MAPSVTTTERRLDAQPATAGDGMARGVTATSITPDDEGATGSGVKSIVRSASFRPASGDRYELLGEIATGGMASVYLGRLRRPMGFSRLVAIKCMHPQYAKDPEFATMFVDEARLTARMRHPNIVPTLDIVEGDGQLLLVMEYVEGESLSALVKIVRETGERIPLPIACAIMHDVLLGLHEAHEAHDDDGTPLAIVHRDVSPQNVLVGVDGMARLLDFGVAKARRNTHRSHDGEIKGKLPYMPPEQLYGDAIDRRVDVYAAGVLLWEALTTSRLFEGPSEEILVRRITGEAIPTPSSRVSEIPAELDALVLKAMARDASGRFPTALAMAERLAQLVALPTRTEISAWVKRFARPQSAKLTVMPEPTRSLVEGLPAIDQSAIVAALERATASSPRATRPSIPGGGTTIEIGKTATPSRRKIAWLVAGAVALCGLTGVGGAKLAGRAAREQPVRAIESAAFSLDGTAKSAPTEDATKHTRATSTPANPSAEAPDARAVDRERSIPMGADASAAARRSSPPSGAGAGKKTLTTPAPSTKSTAGTRAEANATEPSVSEKPADKAGCRLPYVVDADGNRHYKVECL